MLFPGRGDLDHWHECDFELQQTLERGAALSESGPGLSRGGKCHENDSRFNRSYVEAGTARRFLHCK